jgi:hypothetical protein
MDFVDDDAALVSRAPFPESGPTRGAERVRRFLRERFGGGLAIDLTRKQVAGSRVTWTARADPHNVLGTVHAELRRGGGVRGLGLDALADRGSTSRGRPGSRRFGALPVPVWRPDACATFTRSGGVAGR